MTREGWQLGDIEPFLINEAYLLDTRQFETWMSLFTDDGYYWAPSDAEQGSPADWVSLIYDDKERMATRIQRLRHPRIHAQDPLTRTSRIVANPLIETIEDGRCTVRSKFILYDYRPGIPDAEERVFAGTYLHQLVRAEGEIRIAHKKAVLPNCDARLSPFFVYF